MTTVLVVVPPGACDTVLSEGPPLPPPGPCDARLRADGGAEGRDTRVTVCPATPMLSVLPTGQGEKNKLKFGTNSMQ